MDFVIWGYICGGATIFGVIVGIFSVWNGRRTRAGLKEIMQNTHTDLKEVIQSIGTKLDEGFRMMGLKMDEGFRKMDERTSLIAKLIEQIPQKTVHLAGLIKEKESEYETEK